MDNDIGARLLNWAPDIAGVFLLLVFGIVLILATVKRKVKGKLKTFQLLAGASAIGLPVFGALLYFTYDMDAIAAISFVLTLFVCPLGLLVGGIGSIVIRIKHRRNEAVVCWVGGFLLLILGMLGLSSGLLVVSWILVALGGALVVAGLVIFLKGRRKPT